MKTFKREGVESTLVRFLQAGEQKLVALEPDQDVVRNVVQQAGFEAEIRQSEKRLVLEVSPSEPGDPILLFDATDPANLGWFSRCQFYVDGLSGIVLQTPIVISNSRRQGVVQSDRLLVSLSTELPVGFQLPGRQNLSEQVVYALLYNLLTALRENGVAICGTGSIEPLAGGPKRAERRRR